MPRRDKNTLKTYFNTGDRPTESQFHDLIDSYNNISDTVSSGDNYKKLYVKGDESGYDVIKELVTPEMFGAVGDGTTDDATAVQDMCDHLSNIGGGVAYIPSRYLLGSTVTVPMGVHMFGTRKEPQTGFLLGHNGTLLEYNFDSHFTDLVFDGNKANFTGKGFEPATTSRQRRFKWNNCNFRDFAQYAVTIEGGANFVMERGRFEGCDDYAIYETVDGTFGDVPSYNRYITCEVRECKGAVYNDSGSRDIVYDIRIQTCTEHGYNFQGGTLQNPKFRSTINDNDGSAMYVDGANLGGAIFELIVRNNLQNPPAGQYSDTPADIYFESLIANATISLASGKLGGLESVTAPVLNDVGNDCEFIVQGCTIIDEVLGGWWTVMANLDTVGNADFSGVADIVFLVSRATAQEPPYLKDRNDNRFYIGRGFGSFTADGNVERWQRVVRLDASGGVIEVDLPDAGDIAGQVIHFVRHDSSSNNARITCGQAGAQIDGQNVVYLNGQDATTTLIPNGFNYMTSNKDTLTP